MEEIVKAIDKERLGPKRERELELKKLQQISGEPPIIRLVNLTIMQAFLTAQADIHIEPEEEVLKTKIPN